MIIRTIILLLFSYSLIAQPKCMQIGVGLSGSSYWENGENPFIDQAKHRGEWFTFDAVCCGAWDTQLMGEVPVDVNGYPNAGIPYSTSGGMQKVRTVFSANGRIPLGQYVFLYEGSGVFSFPGFSVDTLDTGRVVLTCLSQGNVWVDMDSSAPAPNHVRNIRLLPIAQEFTAEADLFRAPFLEKLDPMYAVRFMDWFHTNNNPTRTWGQRTRPEYGHQTGSAGVAYEYAAELCNRTGKPPWVCVPHLADTNFIIQMARLFHQNLDPELDIYVEFSNETWNWQFQQAHWVDGDHTWLPPDWPMNELFDSTQAYSYNSGLLSKRVFQLWRQEWGPDSNRVQRVLGSQAVWPENVAVQNLLACGDYFDYLSPTFYFGLSTSQSAAFDSITTAQQVIDSCRANFRSIIEPMKLHYDLADSFGGKGVIHYEGGQHISAYGDNNHPALQAFNDAQIHPDLYNLYDEVLDSIRDWGSELAMAFVLGGGNSQYGSWGHIASVDSTPSMAYSPKYMALLANLLPMPSLDLGADTTICTGESVTLDAGPGFVTYTWSDNSSNPTFTTDETGSFAVSIIDTMNCTATDTKAVEVQPLPVVDIGPDTTIMMDTIILSATPGPGSYTYTWYPISSTMPTLTVTATGTYAVTVTDSIGCENSDTINISIEQVPDYIKEANETKVQVRIYPNPSTSRMSIIMEKLRQDTRSVRIRLTDITGRTLFEQQILASFPNTNYQLFIDRFSNGVYLLHVQLEEVVHTFKVVKGG